MTDENKYHDGERLIKKAVAMRFMLNAALSLLLAISYSGTSANLYRKNAGEMPLLALSFVVIVLDSLLTLLWLRHPFFHTLHFVLHFLVHWYGYLAIAVDILNMRGIGAFVLSFLFESVMWIIGLITLIVGAVGRKKRKKDALQEIIDNNAASE